MNIDTVFDINDEVFVMNKNKVKKFSIVGITINAGLKSVICVLYQLNGYIGNWKESELFSSKEELIKSL